jgi:hypothetical protein
MERPSEAHYLEAQKELPSPSKERDIGARMLRLIPGVDAQTAKKRLDNFESALTKKFGDSPDIIELLSETPVASLDDAKSLIALIKDASPDDIRKKLSLVEKEEPKNLGLEITQDDIDAAFEQIDSQLIEKFYLTDRKVTESQKRVVTDQSLETWRDILKSVPDATLFASTAMYLWGKRMHERGETDVPKDFEQYPGDLDVFVKSEASLAKIRDILSAMPSVHFDNNAELKQYSDGTKALSGYMPIKVMVDGEERMYQHDFEFFTADTNRILQGATTKTDTVDGFKVLNLEGLKTQYLNNLAFESRVKRESDQVEKFLHAIGGRELTPEEAEKLQLSPEEIAEYRKLRADYVNASKTQENEKKTAMEGIVRLVSGGLKEKIAKRLSNVEAIAGKRLATEEPTEEVPLARAA